MGKRREATGGQRQRQRAAKIGKLGKRAGKDRLRALLKEWDESGKPKTSAYYRLQSQLAGSDDE